MSLYWLYWIASFLVVIALLSVGAAVQEWWIWRRENDKKEKLR